MPRCAWPTMPPASWSASSAPRWSIATSSRPASRRERARDHRHLRRGLHWFQPGESAQLARRARHRRRRQPCARRQGRQPRRPRGLGLHRQARLHRAPARDAQAPDEVALVDEVRDLEVGEVGDLVGARKVVDGDDVALAAQVERFHQVGTNEARGAGDDDHEPFPFERLAASSSRWTTAVPSLPTTIPAAWFATRIAAWRPAPAATINASTPITVSPAPLTSKTSRAWVGSWWLSAAVKSDMPCSLRV